MARAKNQELKTTASNMGDSVEFNNGLACSKGLNPVILKHNHNAKCMTKSSQFLSYSAKEVAHG